MQVRKKIRVGDLERALAVLARRGVPPQRAHATLCEMARERHISLGRCAFLVAGGLNGARS